MADVFTDHGTASDGGGNLTWTNPDRSVDDDPDTYAGIGAFAGAGIVYTGDLIVELDIARSVGAVTIDADANCDADHSMFQFASSDDGVSWDPIDVTITDVVIVVLTHARTTFTFDDGPITAKYWRLRWQRTVGGFECGVNLHGFGGVAGGSEPPIDEPHVPPSLPRAILEIYVTDDDAALWDVALWDDALWSSSGWVDVTPQGVIADITWGADRPSLGILAETAAGLWSIDTYDPDRILDPGNAESPYAGEIVPGLPIRLSSQGRVIRTGVVERVEYSHASSFGRIRATDKIGVAAPVDVPADTILPATLYARARAAIAAAGVDLEVLPTPRSGDPALAEIEPDDGRRVWEVITDAALEALHVPYLDEHGRLGFRSWAAPLDRGEIIGSDEMVDLVPSISYDGLVSVVRVLDDASATMIERRITPLPAFGERILERDEPTLDASDWADAVLTDRSSAGLRWTPGEVRPYDDVRIVELAEIEQNELVTLDYPEGDPPVEVVTRILQLRVRVVDLGGELGPDWRYYYAGVTAGVGPLVHDPIPIGTPSNLIMIDDDTEEPLYPDGVALIEEG